MVAGKVALIALRRGRQGLGAGVCAGFQAQVWVTEIGPDLRAGRRRWKATAS